MFIEGYTFNTKKYKINRKNNLLFILIILLISIILIKQYIPERIKTTVIQFTSQLDFSNPSKLVVTLNLILGGRGPIYDFAIETWKSNKWKGIGIGSFSKHQDFGEGLNVHNFLLSILVEHGLVGIFFVSLFALILILKMKTNGLFLDHV